MSRSRRPRRRALLPLLAALLLAGCGAYYNTYYNASQAYRKGEKALAESGAKTALPSYDDCLKISSKLLQFYPDSRWVDDTILLIGQCYVRMAQEHRALRKFDELEARFPDSPLLPRARIWRARALLNLGREGDCLAQLAPMDLERLERGDRVQALRVFADLYHRDEDRPRLLEVQERLLRTARRNADKAAAHADLAATCEESGQWEEALRHYNAVRRYRPARALLFRSWLGHLDNNLRLGRLETVERRLRSLRKDERFYEERHALDLRQGWLDERQGRATQAVADWRTILKDFPRTESSAAAAHSLGRVFLFQQDRLDSARVYFKRTSSEKAGSPWADSSKAALELVEALDKALLEVRRLDGLIQKRRAGLDPDSARLELARTFLPRLHARRDSLAADSLRRLASSDSARVDSSFAGDTTRADASAPPRAALTRPPRPALDPAEEGHADSLAQAPARRGGRTRLFDFQKKERETERADSLRRAQAADSLRQALEGARRRALDSLLVAAVLDTLSARPAIDSLRLGSEADSLGRLRIDQCSYLAELQAGRLRRPQRADSLLRVLLEDPGADDEQAPRLRYAYGALRLDQFADSTGRDWLRQVVARWPLSLAANPARDRLGLPRALTLEDSAAVLLEEAEERWQRERDPLAAIKAYHLVAARYPRAPQAGTALLAAGAIAWDELENPALAREDFRRFLKEHPGDPGANLVRRRLGQAVEEPRAAVAAPKQEETQQVATAEAQLDEAGKFVDPEAGRPWTERLAALRERFRETGRLRVEQVLE